MTFFLYPEYHTRSKRFFFPRAIRYSASHANAIIAISESTRRDAIKILRISREKFSQPRSASAQNFSPFATPRLWLTAGKNIVCRKNTFFM